MIRVPYIIHVHYMILMLYSRRTRRGIIMSSISSVLHPICLSSSLWSWVSLIHACIHLLIELHSRLLALSVHSHCKKSEKQSLQICNSWNNSSFLLFFRVIKWAPIASYIGILSDRGCLSDTLFTTVQSQQLTFHSFSYIFSASYRLSQTKKILKV